MIGMTFAPERSDANDIMGDLRNLCDPLILRISSSCDTRKANSCFHEGEREYFDNLFRFFPFLFCSMFRRGLFLFQAFSVLPAAGGLFPAKILLLSLSSGTYFGRDRFGNFFIRRYTGLPALVSSDRLPSAAVFRPPTP